MLFLFKSTPENKKRKHSEHFCRSKGPGGVTKSQQNLLYSEFISEVDLFHKQNLAQSTNYAKTCCVYKGEINLTLLREEPKSIFFSVNFSCFRFFISAPFKRFSRRFHMLWRDAVGRRILQQQCIAQALPLPLTGAFSLRPSLEAVSVQAAAASRALNNMCLSSEQQQKKEIEGGISWCFANLCNHPPPVSQRQQHPQVSRNVYLETQ